MSQRRRASQSQMRRARHRRTIDALLSTVDVGAGGGGIGGSGRRKYKLNKVKFYWILTSNHDFFYAENVNTT